MVGMVLGCAMAGCFGALEYLGLFLLCLDIQQVNNQNK